jgi:D-Tyr-tRNAtyr deacylase
MILSYSVDKKESAGKTRGVIEQVALDDYGVESDGLLEMLDYLRNNVSGFRILTAHETPVEIKDITGKTLSTSWQLLTGGSKIARRIPGFFKEIYQFEVRKGLSGSSAYKVTTKNDGEHFANTILPLPTEIDWTGKNLFEIIKAECAKKGITL